MKSNIHRDIKHPRLRSHYAKCASCRYDLERHVISVMHTNIEVGLGQAKQIATHEPEALKVARDAIAELGPDYADDLRAYDVMIEANAKLREIYPQQAEEEHDAEDDGRHDSGFVATEDIFSRENGDSDNMRTTNSTPGSQTVAAG